MNLSITIRFGKKDGDLMLMVSQYRISDMLVLAVNRYLGKTQECIPLPPNVPYKPVRCATIYLSDDDDETIDFMRQFPNGYRSAAVKMLLRHATERCDLRQLLQLDQVIIEKTKAAPPQPQYLVPAKKRMEGSNAAEAGPGSKIVRPSLNPTVEDKAVDDDEIFDLI